MRQLPVCTLAVLCVALTGCDMRGPRLAIPTGAATEREEAPTWSPPQPTRPATRYQNRTAEQWGELLNSSDRGVILRACQALKVLGAEGRPFLMQGLEGSNPETRRLCLETLTVSDFRAYGEDGKRLLVKLAGDPADLRIRERANLYIAKWNSAVPAP